MFRAFLVEAHSTQWVFKWAFVKPTAVLSSSRKQRPEVETRPGLPSPAPPPPTSPRLLPVATYCHVYLWRKGRAQAETPHNQKQMARTLWAGPSGGEPGPASGREPERKEGFPLHESGASWAKPQGWEPLAGKPSRMGSWDCKGRVGRGLVLQPGDGGVGGRKW